MHYMSKIPGFLQTQQEKSIGPSKRRVSHSTGCTVDERECWQVECLLYGKCFAGRVQPQIFATRSCQSDEKAPVRIKCLTRADQLSDAALRYQVRLAEQLEPGVAVLALNLAKASDMKGISLKIVQQAFAGAAKLMTPGDNINKIFVTGLPNAGKSSLILPLTKARTLLVRKKKQYHLPRVSAKAGLTLGLKQYILEFKKGSGVGGSSPSSVTLVDSPGLRPRLDHLPADDIALLLAAKVLEPFRGHADIAPAAKVLNTALHALNRHHNINADHYENLRIPAYAKALGLPGPTDNVDVFLNAFRSATENPQATELELLRKCQSGEYGGLIFDSDQRVQLPQQKDDKSTLRLSIHRDAAVVCLNDAAWELVKIGAGRADVG